MNQDSIRQIVNDNHGLIAGSVENQIQIKIDKQNNIFIITEEKSFYKTLFVDTEKLLLWELSSKYPNLYDMPNNILDEMKSLLAEIMDLKFSYPKNDKFSFEVETCKLKELKEVFASKDTIQEKNYTLDRIRDEKIICDKIKILVYLVIFGSFRLGGNKENNLFLKIVCSFCKNDQIKKEFTFHVDAEEEKIKKICKLMKFEKQKNKQERIKKYANQTIKYFKVWAILPFEYVIEFQSGLKVTVFNIFFEDEQENNIFDYIANKKLLSVYSPINILERLYAELINTFYLKGFKKQYNQFFNIYDIKKISVEYSKEQIEFRETIKPFYNIEFDIKTIQNETDQNWIDQMFYKIFAIEHPSMS